MAVCSWAMVYAPGAIVATPAAHEPIPFAGLTAIAGLYPGSTPTAGTAPVRLHFGALAPGSTTMVPLHARRAQTRPSCTTTWLAAPAVTAALAKVSPYTTRSP